jgi:hypothetical protein
MQRVWSFTTFAKLACGLDAVGLMSAALERLRT